VTPATSGANGLGVPESTLAGFCVLYWIWHRSQKLWNTGPGVTF